MQGHAMSESMPGWEPARPVQPGRPQPGTVIPAAPPHDDEVQAACPHASGQSEPRLEIKFWERRPGKISRLPPYERQGSKWRPAAANQLTMRGGKGQEAAVEGRQKVGWGRGRLSRDVLQRAHRRALRTTGRGGSAAVQRWVGPQGGWRSRGARRGRRRWWRRRRGGARAGTPAQTGAGPRHMPITRRVRAAERPVRAESARSVW
jgi:hypothetical protein